ncbi:hypothetical protein BH09VER1_BH09VER1_17920 [soil metagenome]
MSTNNPQQQQMIRDAMKSIAERKPGRTKLVYDKTKRTIVAVAEGSHTPAALNITADDADMFAVVTVSSQWLRDHWNELQQNGPAATSFSSWDSGDAFTQIELGKQQSNVVVPGLIGLGASQSASDATVVVELAPAATGGSKVATFTAGDGTIYAATGSHQAGGKVENLEVTLVDVQPALAERRAGILESTVLNEKTVLCVGLGTGGAHAAVELAKCGVGKLLILDRDRLSVGNVVRHPGGISQVGRLKANVVRDLIYEKNPAAVVESYPLDLCFENREVLRQLISQADVVVCGTDNRPSKLLVNQLCVEEGVVAVYGGAFRRAYGGQILRVRPRQSPCHQCFVAAMPEESADVEISSAADASEIAYSDRPVAVEPGLSLDVLPIATMLTKLALLELLADKETSLRILDKDYTAPWYLWLNRPEPGTPYASLPPLSDSSDEMTISRWYGIEFDRDTACPVCGNFISDIAAAYGLDPDALGEIPTLAEKD